MSIEERVRQLEDVEAIRDLFHTYRTMLDQRDLVGYSQLFTDDAEWHGGSMRAVGGPSAILAMLKERFTQGEPVNERHLVANAVIEVDGDRAHATSTYLVISQAADGGPVLRLVGEYDDDLSRTDDGRWLFARRVARVDLPATRLFGS